MKDGGSSALPFSEIFTRLERGPIGEGDVRAAFDAILEGAWTSVQIGAFAAALRLRGETAEQIGAAAEALRSVMTGVDHGLHELVDTCGTGGDGAHTVNISTAAAIVVAACGGYVAKHGNRSVSSRCGSADVVAALGIPIDLAPERQAEVLRSARIAFLMAPAHHPALRHAGAARRELGVRTIFNALGPLVNPARVTHQLLGVYDDGLRTVTAHALSRLGVKRAWVVRSVDGLDEVSPAAETRVTVLDDGRIEERVISAADFGLAPVSLECIRGGDASENAALIERALGGDAPELARVIALNAAAALAVLRGGDLKERAREAEAALASGAARGTLDAWRAAAKKAAGGA